MNNERYSVADDPADNTDLNSKQAAALAGLQPYALIYWAQVQANDDWNWNHSGVDAATRASSLVLTWFNHPLTWAGALTIYGAWVKISMRDKVEFDEIRDPARAWQIATDVASATGVDQDVVWYFMQRMASHARHTGLTQYSNPGTVPDHVSQPSLFGDLGGKIWIALIVAGIMATGFLVREVKR